MSDSPSSPSTLSTEPAQPHSSIVPPQIIASSKRTSTWDQCHLDLLRVSYSDKDHHFPIKHTPGPTHWHLASSATLDDEEKVLELLNLPATSNTFMPYESFYMTLRGGFTPGDYDVIHLLKVFVQSTWDDARSSRQWNSRGSRDWKCFTLKFSIFTSTTRSKFERFLFRPFPLQSTKPIVLVSLLTPESSDSPRRTSKIAGELLALEVCRTDPKMSAYSIPGSEVYALSMTDSTAHLWSATFSPGFLQAITTDITSRAVESEGRGMEIRSKGYNLLIGHERQALAAVLGSIFVDKCRTANHTSP